MAKDILDSGIIQTEWHNESDGNAVVRRVQDAAPILDHVKSANVNMKSGMRHAASIPMVVYEQWDKEFQQQYNRPLMSAAPEDRQKFMKRKLNDPDNALFRTWKGNL